MRCRTCGETEDTYAAGWGRPRDYCSDACRQRGYRLRKRLGDDWELQQPWRVAWDAEREQEAQARREQREAAEKARAFKLAARAAMSPEARARAEKAELDAQSAETERMARLLDRLKKQDRRVAERAYNTLLGKRTGDPCDDERIEKLLNLAVASDSEDEAAAFFAKARTLWRKEPPAP